MIFRDVEFLKKTGHDPVGIYDKFHWIQPFDINGILVRYQKRSAFLSALREDLFL